MVGLYIFILLHQTTTMRKNDFFSRRLYIFILLHQTTTLSCDLHFKSGCISLYSYIKPQLIERFIRTKYVVYLYTPTSNHNNRIKILKSTTLYIFILLHQTTTNGKVRILLSALYIFILLHQTTTTLEIIN